MNISMNGTFGEGRIIQAFKQSGIDYNTTIDFPDNGYVLYSKNGHLNRMLEIDGNILNPMERRLFRKLPKDDSNYIIYFVDRSKINCKWGGQIVYDDPKTNNIREVIYLRAEFYFQIDDPYILLRNNISEFHLDYRRDYVRNLITPKISSVIKSYASQILEKQGINGFPKYLATFSNNVTEKINEDVTDSIGISISDLHLILEEDDEHMQKRNDLDWNVLRVEKFNKIKGAKKEK